MRRYRLAAEQGNPNAQVNLGHMYAAGSGVAQDDAEAMRWYRLAAEAPPAPARTLGRVEPSAPHDRERRDGSGAKSDLVYSPPSGRIGGAMEIATLIAAVVGGVTGLVNTVAIILVNGKVDRLTGRVDVLQEAVMKRS